MLNRRGWSLKHTLRPCPASKKPTHPPAGLLWAAVLARTAHFLLRRLHLGHGSTLPGRLARALTPGLWSRLKSLPYVRFILISGTNGKTTTVHILHHLLADAGWRVESNTSGANLESGLLTTILLRLPLRGASEPLAFVLEVDEAFLVRLLGWIQPQALILTNFCRDQLDRYGELNTVTARLAKAMDALPADLPVILNADDPGTAGLGRLRSCSYFGFEAEYAAEAWQSPLEHHTCGVCKADLAYHRTYLGHYGDWYCPACRSGRPARQTALTKIIPDPDGDGASLCIRLCGGEQPAHLKLPGLHNVYNALAAVETAARLGLAPSRIAGGLSRVDPCFGRGEIQRAGKCLIHLFLIKNPTGANTVLETLSHKPAREIWFLINDRDADGRDVSWLWDVDFEGFWTRNGLPEAVLISGRRALDLAVRLDYSGLPKERLTVMPKIKQGLSRIKTRPGEATCYVLATYTAMLDLRGRIKKAYRW